MKNSIRFVVTIALVYAFFFNSLPNANACGPFTISPLFSLTQHADFPLPEFISGKTGIVPETFGNMSLFVFYRQLNNLSLTKEEQKQIAEAMENQIFYRSGRYDTSANNDSETVPNYYEKWAAARAKVTNEKRDVETEKQIAGDYNYFSNCLPDAFNNATKTLEARIAKYGNGENVKEWVKGQDTVFSNCSASAGLPETLNESAPEWLRQDRDYQIAAAQFYMGDFPAAREKFEKIAADSNSVWKDTAKLVSARSLIRQASFVKDTESEDPAKKAQAVKEKTELLQQASEKLQNILAGKSLNETNNSAYRLLGLVKYRMIPGERKKELAETLARPAENQNLYDDLTDYTFLLDYAASQAESKGAEIDSQEAAKTGKEYDYNYDLKLRDLPIEERSNDLTDWIFTYQAADGFAHAFEKWKETGKAQWFVAAIAKTDAKSPQASEILSEADKIAPNSAAFATVRFHQIRLLLESGKRAEAKQKLDEVIANNLRNLPLSTQNKFFAQRLTLAENLEDFLKFAQRKAVIFDWDENGREEGASVKDDEFLKNWETRTMFDDDSVAFLDEKVPLSVLRQAALSPQLPDHLKRFLVIAVWTRAFVLKDQAIEREFTPLMTRYAKEFSPLFTKYSSATNPANREAAALLVVLSYPVIQPYVPTGFGRENSNPADIDSIRGNWWCNDVAADNADRENLKTAAVYPNFLTAEQMTAAEREQKQLILSGNSATYLARRAVEFANKNPSNPQVPEILHLAVRSTRYGCKDEETLKFSKQAFDILHKRFPNSPWTKKTPYWFGQT